LEAIWGKLSRYLNGESLDKLYEVIRGDLLKKHPDLEVDFIDTALSGGLARLSYCIPRYAQEDPSYKRLKVTPDLRVPPNIVEDYEMLNFFEPFALNEVDKEILKKMLEMDEKFRKGSDINPIFEKLEKKLKRRFTDWLKHRQVHPYLIKEMSIALIILFECYNRQSGEIQAFSKISDYKLGQVVEGMTLLGVTPWLGRFLYVPFMFLCLLKYFDCIGYRKLSEELEDNLYDLQDTVVEQIKSLEGYGELLSRDKFLAAEVYNYSLENYAAHRGNFRFDWLMPRSIEILEALEEARIDRSQAQKMLKVSSEELKELESHFSQALLVVDAKNEAESFKEGLRQSLERALEEGLDSPEAKEKFLAQACYRAADLLYLLESKDRELTCCSEDLRGISSEEERDQEEAQASNAPLH